MKGFVCATFLGGVVMLTSSMTFAAPPAFSNAAEKNKDELRLSREERHRMREQYQSNNARHAHRENSPWQAGATLAEKYRHADNYIEAAHYSQLSEPTRYQQWVRVKRHYILFNVLTNTIIKVIPADER